MGVLVLTIGAGSAASQEREMLEVPVVSIEGPTVIVFAPSPDSVLDSDVRASLFSALDQQQGVFADVRPELASMGVADAVQLSLSFVIQDGSRQSLFEASSDSAMIGVVLAAPGRPLRVLYRVQFRDALLEALRTFLRDSGGPRPLI